MCVVPMLMAGLTLAKGVMDYQTGKANQKMANAEAERIRAMGAVEEAALRRQQDYQLGQQKVDLASSGRSGGTGAALQLAFQSRLEGERTALARRDGHIMQQDQRINEGRVMRAQGCQCAFWIVRQCGRNAAQQYSTGHENARPGVT